MVEDERARRGVPLRTGGKGTYSIGAPGYASFEGEFGSSPVPSRARRGGTPRASSAPHAGRTRPAADRRGGRSGSDHPDAGNSALQQQRSGWLRGGAFDARTRARVVAFAIALWRRENRPPRMVAPASFPR